MVFRLMLCLKTTTPSLKYVFFIHFFIFINGVIKVSERRREQKENKFNKNMNHI